MPADVSGLKVRPPNAVIASWMRQLGAINVQASAPEIRDVLEKGVADAAGSPWGSMQLFGIDKVTKYHIDAPFYVSEQVWVLNKAKYDVALAGAEGRDGPALLERVGAEDRRRPGPISNRAGAPRSKALAGPRGLSADARAACGMAQIGRAGRRRLGEPVRKAGQDPEGDPRRSAQDRRPNTRSAY